MAIQVTPEDVVALNEKLVVARHFTHVNGDEDVWIKGSLNDVLAYFEADLTVDLLRTPEPAAPGYIQ